MALANHKDTVGAPLPLQGVVPRLPGRGELKKQIHDLDEKLTPDHLLEMTEEEPFGTQVTSMESSSSGNCWRG